MRGWKLFRRTLCVSAMEIFCLFCYSRWRAGSSSLKLFCISISPLTELLADRNNSPSRVTNVQTFYSPPAEIYYCSPVMTSVFASCARMLHPYPIRCFVLSHLTYRFFRYLILPRVLAENLSGIPLMKSWLSVIYRINNYCSDELWGIFVCCWLSCSTAYR